MFGNEKPEQCKDSSEKIAAAEFSLLSGEIKMAFASKPRGGKRIGAGRKSNAAKLLDAGFVAGWFTPQFQEIKWNQLVNSNDELVALRAMAYLTDRLYGKPKQQQELSGVLEVAVKRVISDI